MIDPTFNMDKFMSEVRTYIIPEVMEAYLRGDVETLKLWCSEAVSKNKKINEGKLGDGFLRIILLVTHRSKIGP